MIAEIIQARIGSTRLPGKVMMKIRDKPLLYYIINQIKNSKKINKIVIATTETPQDDQIFEYVKSLGVEVYRGNEEDVLDRYYQCSKHYNVDKIVRVTSDCPLIDPEIIDKCIEEFEKNDIDYLSNVNRKIDKKWVYDPCGYPSGFAAEIFTFNALEKTWKSARKPSEREHVSQYMLNNPYLFKIRNIKNSEDFSHIRLTVDHQVDFDLVKKIIEHFPEGEIFKMNTVIDFLNQNLKLIQLNSHILFNEGYLKSLEKDKHPKN